MPRTMTIQDETNHALDELAVRLTKERGVPVSRQHALAFALGYCLRDDVDLNKHQPDDWRWKKLAGAS